eukprot:1331128-Amorphochlora_amoeboformis.AAC.1
MSGHAGRAGELKARYGLRYSVRRAMLDPVLRSAFVQLDLDRGSQNFVENSINYPYSAWYTADGILNMGKMHVLSTSQWRCEYQTIQLLPDTVSVHLHPVSRLIEIDSFETRRILRLPVDKKDCGSLLDVGAGDGAVTQAASSLFSSITAT